MGTYSRPTLIAKSNTLANEFKKCKAYLRHKSIFTKKQFLIDNGIKFNIVIQLPGEIVNLILELENYVYLINIIYNLCELQGVLYIESKSQN